MQVGSLVVYTAPEDLYTNMINPKKDQIYTVRFVGKAISPERPDIHPCIRVEEIVNEIAPNGKEYTYRAEHFREVQKPMNIEELIEQCMSKQLQN